MYVGLGGCLGRELVEIKGGQLMVGLEVINLEELWCCLNRLRG